MTCALLAAPFLAACVALPVFSDRAPLPPLAITPSSSIELFDGTSLANFDTWLADYRQADPAGVFTVVSVEGAPAIRVSGRFFGGLITKQSYRDYRLTVEYRWGGATWAPRATAARDSGLLLHAQGQPGSSSPDFNGPWLRSLEFQIIEGGVGDIIVLPGYNDAGVFVQNSVTVRTRKDRDGEDVFDPRGVPKVFSSARINWWGRSEEWEDRVGFRGTQDVDSPGLGWTRLDAVAEKGTLTYYVNGRLVNAATDASVTEGRIMIQSEGAEIYFRRIELRPPLSSPTGFRIIK
jgi:3-keto-disaccharide hydrolase